MNALEQWLSIATHELTPESVERVRGEIEEHYGSAITSGVSEGDAVQALGDPKAANHEYRKVLLTTREALMAPVYTQPRRMTLRTMLAGTAWTAALIWFFSRGKYASSVVPVLIALWTLGPLRWLLDANLASEGTIRNVSQVHGALVVALAWWYQGWISAVTFGFMLFLLRWALERPRANILRKLASGQTYSPPSDPRLTRMEAIFLNTLRNGDPSEKYALPFIFALLTALAVWQPRIVAPLAISMVVTVFVPRLFPVFYTRKWSRWYRIGKWTSLALAAILPPFLSVRAGWVVAPFVAYLFWMFEWKRISLRRKLPVEEWPKELYL